MKKMLPLLWQIMQQTTKLQEKWSKGKDLVGPAITCFPTSYLSLGSLSMTTKEHWLQCSHQVNGNLGLQRQRMGSLLKIWLWISSFKKTLLICLRGAYLSKVYCLVDSDEKPIVIWGNGLGKREYAKCLQWCLQDKLSV